MTMTTKSYLAPAASARSFKAENIAFLKFSAALAG